MAYIKADSEQEQRWFDYLEELRQSGETNMWGAVPYLLREFPELYIDLARDVLFRWISGHQEPSRKMEKPG